MRNCNQKNCAFLKLGQGCRACSFCGASPFLVADDCPVCYDCENIPNSCRWSDDIPEETEKAGDTAEQGEESEMILIGVKK